MTTHEQPHSPERWDPYPEIRTRRDYLRALNLRRLRPRPDAVGLKTSLPYQPVGGAHEPR